MLGINPDRFKRRVRAWRLPHVREGRSIEVRVVDYLDAFDEQGAANDVATELPTALTSEEIRQRVGLEPARGARR